MRRTASSTSRVGWRATAFSAENCFRPPGCMVWWVYCLSFHLLPVRRTFSALITTTKSPQSACGVKVGLCLPRSTVAMVVAARPSTLSFKSMTTQLRWTVNLLPITVFIEGAPETEQKIPCGKPQRGGGRYAIRQGVSTDAPSGDLPERPSARLDVKFHLTPPAVPAPPEACSSRRRSSSPWLAGLLSGQP